VPWALDACFTHRNSVVASEHDIDMTPTPPPTHVGAKFGRVVKSPFVTT
jgi:hypothetical protein